MEELGAGEGGPVGEPEGEVEARVAEGGGDVVFGEGGGGHWGGRGRRGSGRRWCWCGGGSGGQGGVDVGAEGVELNLGSGIGRFSGQRCLVFFFFWEGNER